MTFKTLLGTAAAVAMMSSVALAQDSTSGTAGSTTTPMAAAPAETAGTTTTTPTVASGEPVLASELIGKSIRGPDGKSIGSVDDLVLDTASGQIQQVIIERGGVLGVGGKSIAVDFGQLQVMPNEGVQASLTGEALDAMPEFDDETTISLDERVETPATAAGAPGVTPVPGAVQPAPGAGAAGTGSTAQ